MAYLVIEIQQNDLQIADLNDKGGLNSGDKKDLANQLLNVLMRCAISGEGYLQATTRSTTAGVVPSGTNSEQVQF